MQDMQSVIYEKFIASRKLCVVFFIGYIGGYGKSSMFDVEWEKLGINEKMAHYVRNQMIRNHRG